MLWLHRISIWHGFLRKRTKVQPRVNIMTALLPSKFFPSSFPANPFLCQRRGASLSSSLWPTSITTHLLKPIFSAMIKSYIKTFASLLSSQYFHITSPLNSQVNYFEQQFIFHYLIQEILSGLGFSGRSCIIPLTTGFSVKLIWT